MATEIGGYTNEETADIVRLLHKQEKIFFYWQGITRDLAEKMDDKAATAALAVQLATQLQTESLVNTHEIATDMIWSYRELTRGFSY